MRTCSKFRANFLTHLARWCVALPQAEGGPMIDKWFRRCIKFDIFQLQLIYGSCVRDLHLGQPNPVVGHFSYPTRAEWQVAKGHDCLALCDGQSCSAWEPLHRNVNFTPAQRSGTCPSAPWRNSSIRLRCKQAHISSRAGGGKLAVHTPFTTSRHCTRLLESAADT